MGSAVSTVMVMSPAISQTLYAQLEEIVYFILREIDQMVGLVLQQTLYVKRTVHAISFVLALVEGSVDTLVSHAQMRVRDAQLSVVVMRLVMKHKLLVAV